MGKASKKNELKVTAERLRRVVNPDLCVRNGEIPEIIGQEAAVKGLKLSLTMRQDEYSLTHGHAMLVGEEGTGEDDQSHPGSRTALFGNHFPAAGHNNIL